MYFRVHRQGRGRLRRSTLAGADTQSREAPGARRQAIPPRLLCGAISSGIAALQSQACPGQTMAVERDPAAIVVTAQRRAERPEDVPISLTAVSGDQLERMQATDTTGLAKVVP